MLRLASRIRGAAPAVAAVATSLRAASASPALATSRPAGRCRFASSGAGAAHEKAARVTPMPLKELYKLRELRRTKIVATIGPASDSPERLAQLLDAGVDLARVNYSHGDVESKTELIKRLREAEKNAQRYVGTLPPPHPPRLACAMSLPCGIVSCDNVMCFALRVRVSRFVGAALCTHPGEVARSGRHRVACFPGHVDGVVRSCLLTSPGSRACGALRRPLGILADLPGPKLRLGSFEGEFLLEREEVVELVCGMEHSDEVGPRGSRRLPVMYGGLSAELAVGDPVLLNDGTVRMVVTEAPGEANAVVTCRVLEPGLASSRKGVNVPGTQVELPSIGEKDKEALTHALHHGVDFVAVSYVRTAEDLVPAMELIAEIAPGTPIVVSRTAFRGGPLSCDHAPTQLATGREPKSACAWSRPLPCATWGVRGGRAPKLAKPTKAPNRHRHATCRAVRLLSCVP